MSDVLIVTIGRSVEGGAGQYLWCWVSMGRYWLVLGGTGSVKLGTAWNLVVIG